MRDRAREHIRSVTGWDDDDAIDAALVVFHGNGVGDQFIAPNPHFPRHAAQAASRLGGLGYLGQVSGRDPSEIWASLQAAVEAVLAARQQAYATAKSGWGDDIADQKAISATNRACAEQWRELAAAAAEPWNKVAAHYAAERYESAARAADTRIYNLEKRGRP